MKPHKFFGQKTTRLVKQINYPPGNRPNRQDFKNQFIENGAIYIIKYKIFMKTKVRLSGKIGLYEMPKQLSVDIDSIEDLKLANYFLKTK